MSEQLKGFLVNDRVLLNDDTDETNIFNTKNEENIITIKGLYGEDKKKKVIGTVAHQFFPEITNLEATKKEKYVVLNRFDVDSPTDNDWIYVIAKESNKTIPYIIVKGESLKRMGGKDCTTDALFKVGTHVQPTTDFSGRGSQAYKDFKEKAKTKEFKVTAITTAKEGHCEYTVEAGNTTIRGLKYNDLKSIKRGADKCRFKQDQEVKPATNLTGRGSGAYNKFNEAYNSNPNKKFTISSIGDINGNCEYTVEAQEINPIGGLYYADLASIKITSGTRKGGRKPKTERKKKRKRTMTYRKK